MAEDHDRDEGQPEEEMTWADLPAGDDPSDTGMATYDDVLARQAAEEAPSEPPDEPEPEPEAEPEPEQAAEPDWAPPSREEWEQQQLEVQLLRQAEEDSARYRKANDRLASDLGRVRDLLRRGVLPMPGQQAPQNGDAQGQVPREPQYQGEPYQGNQTQIPQSPPPQGYWPEAWQSLPDEQTRLMAESERAWTEEAEAFEKAFPQISDFAAEVQQAFSRHRFEFASRRGDPDYIRLRTREILRDVMLQGRRAKAEAANQRTSEVRKQKREMSGAPSTPSKPSRRAGSIKEYTERDALHDPRATAGAIREQMRKLKRPGWS